ncbi:MAG: hypothetical protein M3Z06_02440 [Actinomycetota bacterium]|nr:hypothetical protein [Actinomycetota bacterium]
MARLRPLALPLGCAIVGAGLFAPGVGSGRLADDFVLLRTIRGVTSVVWPFGHNDLGQMAGSGHFYRPLWVLWNAVINQLASSPAAAHLANLGLFGLICGEVAVLLRRLTGQRAALLGGLLFAVFPSHGESVAWISGNTDLLAVALGLAALLVGTGRKPTIGTSLAAAGLVAAAMLSKEIAVVFPVLAAILIWIGRPADAGARERWRPVLAMLGAVVLVLLVRGLVIHGFGGYGDTPLTPRRAGGSLASFSAAALSAPQLQLLQHPVLLLVPVSLAVLIGWTLWRGVQTGRARPATRAAGGLVWFYVALLPVLNQPLNLNTRNGDRLLLLPSVGLAITAAALVGLARRRVAVLAAVPLIAVCGLAGVLNAVEWNTAGHESRRIIAELTRLAPRDAHLVVLSVPTDYREAHLFPDALQDAVQESGRPDVTVITCAPVHALELLPGQVSFRAPGGGLGLGSSTADAPFEVSVLGGATVGAAGCAVSTPAGAKSPSLGIVDAVVVRPTIVPGQPITVVYFDGRDMRGLR